MTTENSPRPLRSSLGPAGPNTKVGSRRRARLARRPCVDETSDSCASLLPSTSVNVGKRTMATHARRPVRLRPTSAPAPLHPRKRKLRCSRAAPIVRESHWTSSVPTRGAQLRAEFGTEDYVGPLDRPMGSPAALCFVTKQECEKWEKWALAQPKLCLRFGRVLGFEKAQFSGEGEASRSSVSRHSPFANVHASRGEHGGTRIRSSVDSVPTPDAWPEDFLQRVKRNLRPRPASASRANRSLRMVRAAKRSKRPRGVASTRRFQTRLSHRACDAGWAEASLRAARRRELASVFGTAGPDDDARERGVRFHEASRTPHGAFTLGPRSAHVERSLRRG